MDSDGCALNTARILLERAQAFIKRLGRRAGLRQAAEWVRQGVCTSAAASVRLQQRLRAGLCGARAQRWMLSSHCKDEKTEVGESTTCPVRDTPGKVVFEAGVWRTRADGENWGPGFGALGLSVGAASHSPPPCLHRVQPPPRALCLATFPPTMGCREAPSRRVSFRYVLGPLGLVLLSLQARPRQAGGRERQVRSSSVCHGLNTVALCWFQRFLSLSPPLPKPEDGRKEMESSPHSPLCTCCHFCPSWFPSYQLRRHDTARPWSGRRWGCFQGRGELSFITKGFFFFLNK